MTTVAGPFDIADAFKRESRDERMTKQAQNALTQIGATEQLKGVANKNILAEMFKAGGKPNDIADQYQTVSGDYAGAEGIRANELTKADAEIARHTKGLDFVIKSAPMVNESNYQLWRKDMVERGYAEPSQLPAEFDQKLMNQWRKTAAKQWHMVTQKKKGGKEQQVMLDSAGNVLSMGPEVNRWQDREQPAAEAKIERMAKFFAEDGLRPDLARRVAAGLHDKAIVPNARYEFGDADEPMFMNAGTQQPFWVTGSPEGDAEIPVHERRSIVQYAKDVLGGYFGSDKTPPKMGTRGDPHIANTQAELEAFRNNPEIQPKEVILFNGEYYEKTPKQ